MTTGRINQVTTIRMHEFPHATLRTDTTKVCSTAGVHHKAIAFLTGIIHSPWSFSEHKERTHRRKDQWTIIPVPRSHKFQTKIFLLIA